MNINRRENGHGLTRSITCFMDAKGQVVNDSITVQYNLNKEICGDVEELTYKVDPHGNAKTKGSFYPVKKSTINGIGKSLTDEHRKASLIYADAVEDRGPTLDFGDYPRSKMQVMKKASSLGLSRFSTPMFEVEAILAYDNVLDEDGVVWAHDLWVLDDRRMENSLRNAAEIHPILIDPTFNHGLFEVTPVTFCHPFIEAKSKTAKGKWADTIMIRPTVIHHEKTDDAFNSGLRPIMRKCNLTEAKFGVVTDGELALINACKRNFPKAAFTLHNLL